MKRKLLISTLLLGIGQAMLVGFDSEATVEDVLNNYTQAVENTASFSADVDMKAQLGVSMSSETSGTSTINVGATGDIHADFIKDPLSLGMNGTMNIEVLGTGQNVEFQMYMVPGEDGSWDSYVYSNAEGDGEWVYSLAPAEQMEQIVNAINTAEMDFSQYPIEFALAENAVDVNGTSCYQLTSSVSYDDIKEILTEAASLAGEEISEDDLSMVGMVLSGIVVNLEMDIAADTYLPLKLHIDLNGSDLSAISQLIAYSMATDTSEDGSVTLPEVSLDITDLYLDYIYDYDTAVDITVPDDALLAKATGNDPNVESIQDLAEEALEEVETEIVQ